MTSAAGVHEMAGLPAKVIAQAAQAVRAGEIVAFPTETFYGLAVDAASPDALERLFLLKGRPGDKASALLVADFSMFERLCAEVSSRARELAMTYWPGPLTLALPARADLPAAIVSDGVVAARVSPHPIATALVAAVGGPITATSANPAGEPPPRTAAQVAAYFPIGIAHILDGGTTPGGEPSTVARVRSDHVEIVRQGAIRL